MSLPVVRLVCLAFRLEALPSTVKVAKLGMGLQLISSWSEFRASMCSMLPEALE